MINKCTYENALAYKNNDFCTNNTLNVIAILVTLHRLLVKKNERYKISKTVKIKISLNTHLGNLN